MRDHPAEAHSLDTLSAFAHSSPFHFHRIFRAVAGETIGSFVGRARLERAAYLMKAAPSRTLTSIALETGFATAQEFSRSFRRAYGVAPSRWDRKSRLSSPEGREAARETPARPPIEVRIVDRPAVRLAYHRVGAPFDGSTLATGLEELTAYLESAGVAWRDAQVVGMSWDNYETTPIDRLHYDLGVAVPPGFEAAPPFGIRELGPFRAAEVVCSTTLEEILHAWDELYEAWFPASDFEPDDLPAMKWFTRPAGEIDWAEWAVSCSIALRRSRGR